MRFLKRFAQGELRLTRIEALSDGVFAIVVTLLVLDLKVPSLHDHGSVTELGHQLLDLFPKFLSWLISFIIVCKFWLNHHHILGLAHHANYSMVWLNAIFLMFQSFVPFSTAMTGESPTNPLAVSMFGVVMAFNTMLFITLHAYILRNLIKPELVDAQDPHIIRKSFVGVVSYLIGGAAAWFRVHAAFLLYMLTPLFFIVPPHRVVLPKPALRRTRRNRRAAELDTMMQLEAQFFLYRTILGYRLASSGISIKDMPDLEKRFFMSPLGGKSVITYLILPPSAFLSF